MKGIKLLILVLAKLYTNNIVGQCYNQVSTNPQNSYNLALPDIESINPPYYSDERYLNGFDWINGNASTGNHEYLLTNMMYNPTQPYGNMANIQDPNLTGYYSYLNKITKEEMNVQNGWELMLINLGKYPDDVTIHSQTTLNTVPYLVFYNRYSGILRVFVQYGYNEPPTSSINGVKIDLFYDNVSPNVSGVLRLADGLDRTLDQETKTLKITAIAPKIGQTVFWMSADFQLTYDPCVCFFPSNLVLNFTFFTEQEFKLYGRGVEVSENLINGTDILDKGFLSNVDYTSGTSENGFIIYNRMEDLIDDYVKQMEAYQLQLDAITEHNEEVEKNIKIAKAVSSIIKLGIGAALGSPEVIALQGDLSQFFFNDQSAESKEKIKNLFKKAEDILGKEMNTWITKNFKAESLPEKPEAATAVFSEMNFDGALISQTPILGPRFNTPGSFINRKDPITGVNNIKDLPIQDVYGYPIFNNPMGLFSLLESPKIKISKTVKDNYNLNWNSSLTISIPYPYYYEEEIPVVFLYESWSKNYQFQLAEDLKYTFNNSLDIKSKKIKVAFIVKPNRQENLSTSIEENNIHQAYLDPQLTTNIESSGYNLDKYSSIDINSYSRISSSYNYERGLNFYNKKPEEINAIANGHIDKTNFEFHSLFIPIDNFSKFTPSIALKNEKVTYDYPEVVPISNYLDYGFNFNFEVELKLIIDIEFNTLNDVGNPNTSTLILTYKIDPSNIEWLTQDIYPNLENSIKDITQYPENYSFDEAVIFDGSAINGCQLNGTHYTCQTWNDTYINANLSTANGYTVDILAGNEIITFPEAIISPEIVLAINSVLDFSHPMPESNATYVENFCNGLNTNSPPYLANQPVRGRFVTENESVLSENLRKKETDFILFPNPTKGKAYLELKDYDLDALEYQVTDFMGKVLAVSNNKINASKYELNVANLEAGMYLVSVKSRYKTITKTLLVH